MKFKFLLIILIHNFYSYDLLAQNIGFGIQNPHEKLHVNGNIVAAKANVNAGVFYRDANHLKYPILTYDHTNEKALIGETLTINDSGNIGINALDASNKLSVSNTILSEGEAVFDRIIAGLSSNRYVFYKSGSELRIGDTWFVINSNKKVRMGFQNVDSKVVVEQDVVMMDNLSLREDVIIKEIRKYTVNADFPNVPSGTSRYLDFNLPGAEVNDGLIMTASFDMPGSLIFSQAHVSSANVARVKFTNEGSNNQNLGPEDYHFVVIKK